MRFRLDERVRDRLVAETRGNPLALLELPRGLSALQLAGGFGLLDGEALPARIEDSFVRRLGSLPTETEQLLLIAAAEPVGDPALLWRAAARLGIGISAAAGAETQGLLSIGDRVAFRHPLVRSAVYGRIARRRRAVHRALADATDPGGSTPTVVRGISRRQQWGRMSVSQWNSSDPPTVPGLAAALPPRRRSCSAPRH